jgi:hypothetical protein
MLTDALKNAGPAALIGTFMGLLPLGYGILYAWRPSEQRLAVMRPLSLAAIFASIHATALGVVNFFRWVASRGESPLAPPALIGLSESFVPIAFAFGCLMLAWLCVAIGMSRRTG